MRILLISASPAKGRLHAIAGAAIPTRANVSHTRPEAPPADLEAFDAIILDGDQGGLSPTEVDRLRRYVEAGGSLLAVDAASVPGESALNEQLLGCRALIRLPSAEFFAKSAEADGGLARGIPAEFPFVDAFAPLQPLNGQSRALLTVSVRFTDHAAVVERLLGRGRVVVSALGATDAALQTPALRTLLRRALPRRSGERDERALGVAIVGYGPLGGMGYSHGRAVQNTVGLRLAGVCDRSEEQLGAARADFPEIRCYRSTEAVASDDDIDVVIIATPPSTHVELAAQMLAVGRHVVVEKPLCFTVAEAKRLLDQAAAMGVALTVNQNRRWDPDFLAIHHAVVAGALGEVFNMETFVGSFAHPCRQWHSERSISGGVEYDWGAHHIDWILQIMPGLPARVMATGHKRVWHDVSNFDQMRVRMLWADGREAEFMHSDVAAIRRPKFYVQGTRGTLAGSYRPLISERFEPGRGYVREESHHAQAPAELTLMHYESAADGLSEQRLPLVREDPYAFHRNLADHLHFDDPPLAVTPESICRVIAVLEAAHRSGEQGGAAVTPVV